MIAPARASIAALVRATARIACACALLARVAAAQPVDKPRLEPLRVAGEVVVGGYAGIGGFVVGRFVAEGASSLLGVDHEGTLRKLGFAGGVIGGGLATAGTVYAIGNIGDQTGDFDATYLGTGIGFVAALGIAKMVLGPEGRPREGMSTASRWAAANVIALLPAIGATIGFNSTLRHR
jgi:hypothetical protein